MIFTVVNLKDFEDRDTGERLTLVTKASVFSCNSAIEALMNFLDYSKEEIKQFEEDIDENQDENVVEMDYPGSKIKIKCWLNVEVQKKNLSRAETALALELLSHCEQ